MTTPIISTIHGDYVALRGLASDGTRPLLTSLTASEARALAFALEHDADELDRIAGVRCLTCDRPDGAPHALDCDAPRRLSTATYDAEHGHDDGSRAMWEER